MPLRLSFLDLLPVGVGQSPSQVIRDTVTLARTAEQLGFERYWVAEHHNMRSIASSAPEVLIPHVAAATSRIRVGAGGIMVPNHTPLRVVEIFRTLEALHPGRIDLGLGRAPGTDPLTAAALRRSDDPEVNHLLAELFAFDKGTFPGNHPFRRITPMPDDVRIGSIWMLGSTLAGASIAAQLGLPYAFAGHFAMRNAKEAIAHYKQNFQPSPVLEKPYAILAITTICAETDEEAERLTAPMKLSVVRARKGLSLPIATVEEALRFEFSPEEQAVIDEFAFGAAIGSPSTVAEKLKATAREYDADELMLSNLVPDTAFRCASLERITNALAG